MGSISDLQKKRFSIEQCGGTEKVKKQHDSGKKTARERIALLFDEGSFVEVGAFVTHRCKEFNMTENDAPAEGVVTGYGTIDGRLVYAYSQDFTVIGGSVGEMHGAKICKILDMALKMGAPVIAICDSGGARIQEGADALKGYGEVLCKTAKLSGVVPQISLVLGVCAGGAVFAPAMNDFVIMADKTSQMFVNGASVITGVSGKETTPEEVGGSEVHTAKSGVAGIRCATEEECIAQAKLLLSYLPSNNLESAPIYDCTDDLNRISSALDEVVPCDSNAPFNMKTVISEVADNGEFVEIFSEFATNIITGFVRMNGSTVGVVANNPEVMSGMLDSNSSEKAASFVRFCDGFNIPVVTFTDASGYVPSKEEENNGIAIKGAKLFYAFAEATVPKINVITRRAYGAAYLAMNSKHLGADMVYAWPSAEIAVVSSDTAANIIFKNDIAASSDPMTTRSEKIAEYKEKFANPYNAASRGYVDDIICPSATRQMLIGALEMLMSKRESGPAKKHGNSPL